MMFYNGFNLMIDIILAGIVARIAYSLGYENALEDKKINDEREAYYYLEQTRETY